MTISNLKVANNGIGMGAPGPAPAPAPALIGLVIVCLSLQPAAAACTRWQAEAAWSDRVHIGIGRDQPAALAQARNACSKAALPADAKQICQTAEPKRQKYLCTDGKCIHVAIEDGLGWRAHQGWSREAFCIDRGFDGVIRDASDDQSGVCYKGTCG